MRLLSLLLLPLALVLINEARVVSGCQPLRETRPALVREALQHSRAMAKSGDIYHSELKLGQWSLVGEVVGVGGTVRQVVRALFNSPEHRRILLDCRYDKAAIGIYRDNGVWLTGRFYAA
jgi:uncharacterized protein YkwD